MKYATDTPGLIPRSVVVVGVVSVVSVVSIVVVGVVIVED